MPRRRHVELPIEIVLEILRFAVDSSHAAALAVSLVAKWCHALALPRLFTTLTIAPTFRPAASRRAFDGHGRPPSAFPAHHGPLVRHIWIDKTRLDERGVRGLFDVCRSATSLALSWDRFRDLAASQYLWGAAPQPPAAERGKPHAAALHYPRAHVRSPCAELTLLSPWIQFVYRDAAFGTRTACSLFLALTHLRLLDYAPRALPLPRLVNLTHLAVPPPAAFVADADAPAATEGIEDVLESDDAPRLVMVLLTVDVADWKGRRTVAQLDECVEAEDERLFVVHSPCKAPRVKVEWQQAALGGESIWDRAVRERRQRADARLQITGE